MSERPLAIDLRRKCVRCNLDRSCSFQPPLPSEGKKINAYIKRSTKELILDGAEKGCKHKINVEVVFYLSGDK